MSIVLDALNKAEKERNKGGLFSGASESKIVELKKKYKKIIIAFLLLNLIALSFALFLFFNRDKTSGAEAILKTDTEENHAVDEEMAADIQKKPSQELSVDTENAAGDFKEAEPEIKDVIIRNNYMQLPTGREVKFSGIMDEGGKKYVFVEDEILTTGDEYYQVYLEEISKRQIKVKYKGKTYEIPS